MQLHFRTIFNRYDIQLYWSCCKLNLSHHHHRQHHHSAMSQLCRYCSVQLKMCWIMQVKPMKNDENCYGNGKRPRTQCIVCVAKIHVMALQFLVCAFSQFARLSLFFIFKAQSERVYACELVFIGWTGKNTVTVLPFYWEFCWKEKKGLIFHLNFLLCLILVTHCVIHNVYCVYVNILISAGVRFYKIQNPLFAIENC